MPNTIQLDIAETVTIYDSVIAKKALVKGFLDLVQGGDTFSKVSTISIKDSLYDVGSLARHSLVSKFDLCYSVELVTRVIYVLITIKELALVYDFLSRSQIISFKDFLHSTDFVRKRPLISNFDLCYNVEFVTKVKHILRLIKELVFVYDFFKGTWIMLVRDILYSTDFITKLPIINKFDLCYSVELVTKVKHYIRSIKEPTFVYDILSIGRIISVRDLLYDTGYVTKQPTINKYELGYSAEIVAKVMYTLMQKIVRRVYFLPTWYAIWRDIILASDHNTKVLICRAFLDAFKNVRDKLLGKRISVNDSCEVSDSVEVIKT
jgi:hypothetical protein